jgi:hypothetical protein
MNSNMNFPAPLSAMAFLGMVAFLMLSVALGIGFAFGNKRRALRATASFALIAVVVYSATLLLFSVVSQRVVLASGQEKYFCELDCHLAYSVVSAGYEADPQVPGDRRYVVELQTRFDPTTAGPQRGKEPLRPSPREVVIVDAGGHEYRPAEMQGPSLMTPIRPGESYRTKLVFEVQGMAGRPFLWVHTKPDAPEWMMIGNEVSPLHRKVFFQL